MSSNFAARAVAVGQISDIFDQLVVSEASLSEKAKVIIERENEVECPWTAQWSNEQLKTR